MKYRICEKWKRGKQPRSVTAEDKLHLLLPFLALPPSLGFPPFLPFAGAARREEKRVMGSSYFPDISDGFSRALSLSAWHRTDLGWQVFFLSGGEGGNKRINQFSLACSLFSRYIYFVPKGGTDNQSALHTWTLQSFRRKPKRGKRFDTDIPSLAHAACVAEVRGKRGV